MGAKSRAERLCPPTTRSLGGLMHHRIVRTALAVLMLAAGHAGASAAHPAKPRACGSLGVKSAGMPVSAVVARGATSCSTAKRVLRAYFRSDAACEGSACVREH